MESFALAPRGPLTLVARLHLEVHLNSPGASIVPIPFVLLWPTRCSNVCPRLGVVFHDGTRAMELDLQVWSGSISGVLVSTLHARRTSGISALF